ncbi:MAG: choice-of-anchor tandem repeat GloVer-containing protein [Bryobacteraceae bacterium]|jgi:hypothetical protein
MKAPLALLAATAAVASAGGAPAAGQPRFSTIYNFTDGFPLAISRIGGVIYGAFQKRVNSFYTCGLVFSLEPSSGVASGEQWKETVLYHFPDSGDACEPTTAPIPGPGGALYGLASALYELQPPAEPGGTWTESVDYSLSAPVSSLVYGPAGSFYALNVDGGIYFDGDLLQLTPPAAPGGSWMGTDLFDFPGGHSALALNSLVAGPDGLLYGTSTFGSSIGGYGTAFQLSPPASGAGWNLKILHNFGAYAGRGAGDPIALTPASDGTLYGITYGPNQFGGLGQSVVFQLTPPASGDGDWTYTVLFLVHDATLDSPLVLRGGNLYGTYFTPSGGVVFELQPPAASGGAWTVKYLHEFTDGQNPFGPLVMDENGVVYGTTGATLDNNVQIGTAYRLETQ